MFVSHLSHNYTKISEKENTCFIFNERKNGKVDVTKNTFLLKGLAKNLFSLLT